MNPVFLDTVGLIALWDEDDQWHGAALAAWKSILASNIFPITTNFVLLECGNAAARRRYRLDVDLLRVQFERANRLIQPDEEQWQSAWRRYAGGYAGEAGIVDQISFLVMGRLGITDAFTNDRHFKAAGFNTLF